MIKQDVFVLPAKQLHFFVFFFPLLHKVEPGQVTGFISLLPAIQSVSQLAH